MLYHFTWKEQNLFHVISNEALATYYHQERFLSDEKQDRNWVFSADASNESLPSISGILNAVVPIRKIMGPERIEDTKT